MRRFIPSLASAVLFAVFASTAIAQEVNVYTTREPKLAQPLFDAFTKHSGVKVNVIFIEKGMAERVAAEGANSPADVLMAVDIGNILDAVNRGVTQSVKSEALNSAIPANLRDKDGHWFALSLRARLFYVSKERVKETALTYADLADPKWKGKVCIRSGLHPYNTALVAAYINHYGVEKTEAWLRGVKANLARKPAGGDREVARDILGGICDIGLANSYYVGLMRGGSNEDQKKWGAAINTILPTFPGGGTHVNVSGASVALHAKNKENAIKLLEFLVSNEAQSLYAKANYEYPVRPGAPVDPIIAGLGTLKTDQIDLTLIAKNRKQAADLIEKVGFDQ
ncbi:MAG: Fe(3+) ABC transporter substrate-binding protein [Xanthobacteraceae bacterium]|nr:Fe(3+) ABC transporter substrate-binding protein [Xanthobacteraceae bacterium]QYK45441.1 MAG: Fe(3+) ABC transporter substrate-binding protein [Xanthobacteraceae bacterium]HMN51896.1 Fe(3+) ABC transporter substrate-binding protein [Xanthobacteraceae bacterium]